jgi:hypothetical protein
LHGWASHPYEEDARAPGILYNLQVYRVGSNSRHSEDGVPITSFSNLLDHLDAHVVLHRASRAIAIAAMAMRLMSNLLRRRL